MVKKLWRRFWNLFRYKKEKRGLENDKPIISFGFYYFSFCVFARLIKISFKSLNYLFLSLQKLLLFWHRKSESEAFRKWCEIIFKTKEAELSQEVEK